MVGAGPAGSATARDIALEGYKVLVIEEHPKVGQPVHCSGLITPRTLELAKIKPSGIVLNTISGAIVHSSLGESLHLKGNRTQALVIDRGLFDQALSSQAREAGAELMPGTRATGFEYAPNSINLYLQTAGKSDRLSTRLLIGADGVRSSVSRWMNVGPPQETIKTIGAILKLDNSMEGFVDVFVGSRLAPGWFGWSIPLGDGYSRIGIGTSCAQQPLTAYLRLLWQHFPLYFNGYKPVQYYGGLIPIGIAGKTSADNMLIVGDAACQVKPLSGGGIYSGLVAAGHCAATAVDALKNGNFSQSFLKRYDDAWKSTLENEFKRGIDLRKVYLSLNDREISQLLKIFQDPALQKIISGFGDIDHPSSMFGSLFKSSKAMKLFLHTSLNFPHLWKPWLG